MIRKQANGWVARHNGEELRDDDGRVRRWDRKADAQQALDKANKPKKRGTSATYGAPSNKPKRKAKG